MAELLVSELIKAAQEYMARRGDTAVGIVVNGPPGPTSVLHIEPAQRTGEDAYEPDGGPWYFEVECDVPPDDVCRGSR